MITNTGKADKRRAVKSLLNDDEWQQWPDREISRRCGVSNQFVSNLRAASVNHGQIERKVQRGGKVYTQNTTNIGTNQDKPVFDNTETGERQQ